MAKNKAEAIIEITNTEEVKQWAEEVNKAADQVKEATERFCELLNQPPQGEKIETKVLSVRSRYKKEKHIEASIYVENREEAKEYLNSIKMAIHKANRHNDNAFSFAIECKLI